jgi:hypothetical protein
MSTVYPVFLLHGAMPLEHGYSLRGALACPTERVLAVLPRAASTSALVQRGHAQ